MSVVRLRRLSADHTRLKEYIRLHPRVRLIQSEGEPPERYQLEYRIKSLRMVDGELQPVQSHLVEIHLPLNYPRTPPQCRMLSPVFHPNIAPHAICVGDHWSAGESLQSIVMRIGEMLAYQSYNVKSPLNGEAARWVEENKLRVPLDTVSMLVEEEADGASTVHDPGSVATIQTTPPPFTPQPAPSPAAEEFDMSIILEPIDSSVAFEPLLPTQVSEMPTAEQILCPHCAKSYRRMAPLLGKKVRCKQCQQVFIYNPV